MRLFTPAAFRCRDDYLECLIDSEAADTVCQYANTLLHDCLQMASKSEATSSSRPVSEFTLTDLENHMKSVFQALLDDKLSQFSEQKAIIESLETTLRSIQSQIEDLHKDVAKVIVRQDRGFCFTSEPLPAVQLLSESAPCDLLCRTNPTKADVRSAQHDIGNVRERILTICGGSKMDIVDVATVCYLFNFMVEVCWNVMRHFAEQKPVIPFQKLVDMKDNNAWPLTTITGLKYDPKEPMTKLPDNIKEKYASRLVQYKIRCMTD